MTDLCRRFPSISSLVAVLMLSMLGSSMPVAAGAQVPEAAYSDLEWRLVGPFRSGWATAVAGIPGEPATYYFGGADGGVWRTTDAGSTWPPSCESAPSGRSQGACFPSITQRSWRRSWIPTRPGAFAD